MNAPDVESLTPRGVVAAMLHARWEATPRSTLGHQLRATLSRTELVDGLVAITDEFLYELPPEQRAKVMRTWLLEVWEWVRASPSEELIYFALKLADECVSRATDEQRAAIFHYLSECAVCGSVGGVGGHDPIPLDKITWWGRGDWPICGRCLRHWASTDGGSDA
ncbi:MAG: hypothetical protein ACRDK3_00495 [Actinomycetota bacterium]